MIRPDVKTLQGLAAVNKQYPEVLEFIEAWRLHELETLPSVINNVALQQGRCQVLGEIVKLVKEAPSTAAKVQYDQPTNTHTIKEREMAIPKQVQKQSEAVQELYKELNEEEVNENQEAPQQEEQALEEVPTADSVEEVAVESSGEHSEGSQEKSTNWQQKYKTLQGMYNAEVPQLKQLVQEQGAKINQFEQLMATINQQKQQQQQAPQPILSEKEVEEYGESIDIMRKVTKEETGNLLGEVSALKAQIAQMAQNTVPQVQQLANQVGDTQEQLFWSKLATVVPNWQELNEDENFQNWLLEVDPLTGMARQAYLEDAQRRYDVDRVAAFFTTWSDLNGNGSAQQVKSTNQNELKQQVAPKKSRSAGAAAPTGSKPSYTTADIAAFYDDIRKGKFKGREDERAKIERDIFAAQAEGRIT